VGDESISFEVTGTLRGWTAPSFSRKTGHAYKPNWERVQRESIQAQAMPHRPTDPWTGPLAVTLMFQVPIPRSWARWRREVAPGHPAVGKPDLDNMVKAVLDALKGMFFLDDTQVASLMASNHYSAGAPGVRIGLVQMDALPATKADWLRRGGAE